MTHVHASAWPPSTKVMGLKIHPGSFGVTGVKRLFSLKTLLLLQHYRVRSAWSHCTYIIIDSLLHERYAAAKNRQPSGICSWYALYMYGHCVPTYSCAKRRTKACTIIVVLCTSAVGDWALSIYVYCLCDRRQLHKTEVTYRTCANSMVGVTWRGHSPHAFSVQWREPACLLHCCCTDIVVLWVALDRDTARFCSREVNVNEHIALIIGC